MQRLVYHRCSIQYSILTLCISFALYHNTHVVGFKHAHIHMKSFLTFSSRSNLFFLQITNDSKHGKARNPPPFKIPKIFEALEDERYTVEYIFPNETLSEMFENYFLYILAANHWFLFFYYSFSSNDCIIQKVIFFNLLVERVGVLKTRWKKLSIKSKTKRL